MKDVDEWNCPKCGRKVTASLMCPQCGYELTYGSKTAKIFGIIITLAIIALVLYLLANFGSSIVR